MAPTFELSLNTADKQTLATLAVGTVAAANAWWASHFLEMSFEDRRDLKTLIDQLDAIATRLNALALQDSLIKADADISAAQLKAGLARVNATLDEIQQVREVLKGLAAVLTVITQLAKAITNPTPANIGGAINTIRDVFN